MASFITELDYVLSRAAPTVSATSDVGTNGVFRVDGVQVVSNRGAAVADATGGATIDAEARTAINSLLARLRAHGLIA